MLPPDSYGFEHVGMSLHYLGHFCTLLLFFFKHDANSQIRVSDQDGVEYDAVSEVHVIKAANICNRLSDSLRSIQRDLQDFLGEG